MRVCVCLCVCVCACVQELLRKAVDVEEGKVAADQKLNKRLEMMVPMTAGQREVCACLSRDNLRCTLGISVYWNVTVASLCLCLCVSMCLHRSAKCRKGGEACPILFCLCVCVTGSVAG